MLVTFYVPSVSRLLSFGVLISNTRILEILIVESRKIIQCGIPVVYHYRMLFLVISVADEPTGILILKLSFMNSLIHGISNWRSLLLETKDFYHLFDSNKSK